MSPGIFFFSTNITSPNKKINCFRQLNLPGDGKLPPGSPPPNLNPNQQINPLDFLDPNLLDLDAIEQDAIKNPGFQDPGPGPGLGPNLAAQAQVLH